MTNLEKIANNFANNKIRSIITGDNGYDLNIILENGFILSLSDFGESQWSIKEKNKSE